MELAKIKIGSGAPQKINVVIEIFSGSAVKFELNAKTGNLLVNRFVGSALTYPFDYGFIPETLADDGDALDAVVLSNKNFKRIRSVRPIGVLVMSDEHGRDEKIITISDDESIVSAGPINDLSDLSLIDREKAVLFFKQYKEMEKDKWSKVYSLKNKAEAIKVIERCRNKYKK